MSLISLNGISLAFGGPQIFESVTLQIEDGDKIALLGRNGTGKSTLLKLINKEIQPDGGSINNGIGIKTSLVSQDIPDVLTGSVFDIAASGMGNAAALLEEYHAVANKMALSEDKELISRLETLQKELEDTGGWSLHQEVESILSHLSLDPEADFISLSGGTKRKVMLARALLSKPDILLLDEPTNHLDISTILWLEEYLQKNIKTFIMVTHDRMLARRVSNRIAEMDRGRIYSFRCGYDEFIEKRDALLEAEQTKENLFDKKLAQEEAWIRKGIKARRTRNEGRVRALVKMREEFRKRRDKTGSVKISMQEAQKSGALVAEATDVSFSYDQGSLIIKSLNTTIMRGDRIGVIGPNGSGKTTLLKLLLGELSPSFGAIRVGTKRETIYFDQLREQLDLEKSVALNVGEGNDNVTINGKQRHIIGYLQDFLFSPDRARTPVRILSGGERNRLLLAKLFTKPSNILVMDEPTNDLDAETLELLEEILSEYSGTIIVVSHDREFLNNIVTSTLVLSGNGKIEEFVGGYDDWLRQCEIAAPVAEKAVKSATKARVEQTKPRKLSFKDQQELTALPDQIENLENELAAIHSTLADPDFYKNRRDEAAALNERCEKVEKELEIKMDRWGELENIKENCSGSLLLI